MSSLWICLWWRHPGHTCRKHTDPPRILYQSWARDNFGATTRQCDVVFYCSFCDKLKSEESLLLGIKMKFWRFTRVLWKATFFGGHTTVPNCRNSCSVCPAIFSTVQCTCQEKISDLTFDSISSYQHYPPDNGGCWEAFNEEF